MRGGRPAEGPRGRFCEDHIWDALSPEETARLRRACSVRRYRRDEVVFQQHAPPEGLYCIRSGQVLLVQVDPFGNETAFRIAVGGEVIGYRSLFAEQPHAASARVLAPSSICFIPLPELNDLRGANHALDGFFLRALARDPGFNDAPLLRSPLLPLRVRYAYLLTVLREHHARREGSRLRYRVPLTQRDTGAMLGARPETVARLHRELEREGVCRFRRGEILVLDYARVLDILGTPPGARAEEARDATAPGG